MKDDQFEILVSLINETKEGLRLEMKEMKNELRIELEQLLKDTEDGLRNEIKQTEDRLNIKIDNLRIELDDTEIHLVNEINKVRKVIRDESEKNSREHQMIIDTMENRAKFFARHQWGKIDVL